MINILKKELQDIIVTGYTELGDIAHFSPMLWWVYLKFESDYILLTSNDGTISFDNKNLIECNFEIEEEDLFTISSFSKSEYGLISKVDFFYNDSNLTSIGFSILKNNNYVLIDALDYNGFNIQQHLDRDIIIKNNSYNRIDSFPQ